MNEQSTSYVPDKILIEWSGRTPSNFS